jgi:hypothetical protein
VFEPNQRFWRVSENREGLGLCCAEDGLFLANTSLLDRDANGFTPRPQPDLETILSHGFGFAVSLDRVMSGLATVASALNAGDLCRARIAAVHLRIPDLPNAVARLDMQFEDVALKLDRVAKTTAAGDWDPDKHPRAGTAPNPGWFASTSGEDGDVSPTLVSDKPGDDGRFHLPPGERNDEIGDLLEWIANAKPGDVDGINSEIDRLFSQVGDFQDAAALHSALGTVLSHPDDATRQKVLDAYEPITHRDDPSKGADLITDLATNALFGPAFRFLKPGAEAAVTTEEAATAAAEAASEVWGLGWAARGRAIETAIKPTLPKGAVLADNFPGIDHSAGDLITSIKSIDLNAGTYQQPEILARRIDKYVESLAEFTSTSWSNATVEVTENTERQLIIAVPKGAMSPTQQQVIDAAIMRAHNRVQVRIVPF